MRRYATVTILGSDGTGPMPDISDTWRIVIPEARAQFPDFDINVLDGDTPLGQRVHPHRQWCTDRVIERIYAWFAAGEHNTLVAPLNRLHQLGRECPRATAEVDYLYADMDKNTTINWLAAHHRFTKATIRAQALLAEAAELTTELAGRDPSFLKNDRSPANITYVKHVPADQQIVLPTQAAVDRAQLAVTSFVTLSTTRFGILRATLTGAYPPGFQPAGTETPTQLTDEPTPIAPALAFADHAMQMAGPEPGDPDAHARNW